MFFAVLSDGYRGIPNKREDLVVYVKNDHLYTAKATFYYEKQLIKNKGICDIHLQVDIPSIQESP